MMIGIELICIAVYVCISLLNYLKDKHWFRPNVFVPIIYSIILLLAMLRLYGLYEGTTTAKCCIYIGVFGFLIGTAFSERFRFKRTRKTIIEPKNIDKFLFVILVICFFGSVATGIQNLMAGAGLSEIRTLYFSSGEEGGSIISVLREYFLNPLPIIYLSVAFSKAMNGSVKKWHLITGTLVVLSDIVISASRKSLIIVLVLLFIYFSENKIYLSRRIRRIIIIGTVILAGLAIGVSVNRGSSGILRETYHSLCGCVPLLGNYIERQGTDLTHTVCFAAFHGIFSFPFLVFNYVGIMGYPSLYMKSTQYLYTQVYLPVSDSHRMCAFVTPFYDFYIDGGYIGIFFGMMLFGIICQSAYREMMHNRNIRNTAIFGILMYGLATPYGHFMFSTSKYVIAIILICIMYRGRSNISGTNDFV